MRALLLDWEDLPEFMRTNEVKPYWERLNSRYPYLIAKRVFDIVGSATLSVALSPIMGVLAIMIKLDSPGPIMFRQERVTQYGRRFRIHKFRTMVVNAEKIGPQVTSGNDSRITAVGGKIRKLRLDELPQLFDILAGDMSFVGTRPEAPKYVNHYENEWMATLLLPAGVTSEASIAFKDEDALLASSADSEDTYVREVLPSKMEYCLKGLRRAGFFYDLQVVLRTIAAVAMRRNSATSAVGGLSYYPYQS